MFERVFLIHYHEIGLKGRNRSVFERRLQSNLDAALLGLPVDGVDRIASRLAVRITDPARTQEVAERIALVPGVSGVSLSFKSARIPEQMEQAALLALAEAPPHRTFRVSARRSNTDYAESSMAMNRRIGAFLQAATGAEVDLSSPDVDVSVVVTQGHAYVSSRRLEGVGGLPVGSAGRVVSLLSAGIDSPVATWRMMRRGAVVVGVHFSGRPQTSDLSERIVTDVGRVLEPAGGLARIYVVPFGDIQQQIALVAPSDLRVVLYRRLMVRVAEEVARFENAKALVTGESLGQVASQTLENIAAIDDVAALPVLRPLIGSDKQEIIAEARALGTFGLSTQEHTDCCTLFMPRTPETHAKLPAVLEAWAMLDVEDLTTAAIAGMSRMDFACSAYRPPKGWPNTEARARPESSGATGDTR